MKKYCYVVAILLFSSMLLTGCKITKAGTEKIRDLEYTVVDEEDIPDLLKEEIEQKKAEDFKLSYLEEGALYIARGFGMQETGGYSIQMQELYLADNAIYFKADLIGPEDRSGVSKAVSYPYIVIKTERRGENVIFD